MSEIQHFLLTRFNLSVSFSERPVHLDPGWLAERFAHFERFCLPSIRAQSSRDFQWIVLMHSDTPAAFLDRMTGLRESFPAAHVEWMDGDFEPTAAAAIVRRRLDAGTTHVITSRVDSDDCLADRFIETVQLHARPTDRKRFISFPRGYKYGAGKCYRYSLEHPPFSSLIEPVNDIETVYCVSHMDIHLKAPVDTVDTDRFWLIHVHGNNAVNELDGWRCGSGEVRARFGIQIPFVDEPWTRVLLEQSAHGMRRVRDRTVAFLHRLRRGLRRLRR